MQSAYHLHSACTADHEIAPQLSQLASCLIYARALLEYVNDRHGTHFGACLGAFFY